MRASAAGIGWPLPADMTEGELERQLYPSANLAPRAGADVPDWPAVQAELRKKHVTLRLLFSAITRPLQAITRPLHEAP